MYRICGRCQDCAGQAGAGALRGVEIEQIRESRRGYPRRMKALYILLGPRVKSPVQALQDIADALLYAPGDVFAELFRAPGDVFAELL